MKEFTIQNLLVAIRMKYKTLSLLVEGTSLHDLKLFEINDLEQNLWILSGKSYREFEV